MDLSPERHERALTHIRHCGILDRGDLSAPAILTYALGLFVCDDTGVIKQTDLEAAYNNPEAIEAAAAVLNQATAERTPHTN